ncbi:MAG: hypothetical protein HOV83_37630 [Catenulispora sp.]|nr:hypothetical protein [Catenulispora sp.]
MTVILTAAVRRNIFLRAAAEQPRRCTGAGPGGRVIGPNLYREAAA